MSRPVRIEIDRDACVGSSICVATAGAVFRLDGSGLSSVRDAAGASLATILDAAEGCPTMAITVRDAATGDILFGHASGT